MKIEEVFAWVNGLNSRSIKIYLSVYLFGQYTHFLTIINSRKDIFFLKHSKRTFYSVKYLCEDNLRFVNTLVMKL